MYEGLVNQAVGEADAQAANTVQCAFCDKLLLNLPGEAIWNRSSRCYECADVNGCNMRLQSRTADLVWDY